MVKKFLVWWILGVVTSIQKLAFLFQFGFFQNSVVLQFDNVARQVKSIKVAEKNKNEQFCTDHIPRVPKSEQSMF